MTIKSKKYRIGISKEKFFQILKNRYRLPVSDSLVHPLINRHCEWITGDIREDSFLLIDYRFSKIGIKIEGKVLERNNDTEIITSVIFNNLTVIIQIVVLLSFLYSFYLGSNVFYRFSIIFTIIIGEILNYFIISSIIKNFYIFFEKLFLDKNLIIEE